MKVKSLFFASIALTTLGHTVIAGAAQSVITERDQAVVWGNTGSAGGAQRQPGYIHVLHNKNDSIDTKTPLSDTHNSNFEINQESKGLTEEIEKAMAVVKSSSSDQNSESNIKTSAPRELSLSSGQGYSIYEMQRWERFCDDKGVNMDSLDKAFVKEHGGIKGVPSTLSEECDPPTI